MVSWYEAVRRCKSLGGFLVKIGDADEQSFVTDRINISRKIKVYQSTISRYHLLYGNGLIQAIIPTSSQITKMLFLVYSPPGGYSWLYMYKKIPETATQSSPSPELSGSPLFQWEKLAGVLSCSHLKSFSSSRSWSPIQSAFRQEKN